MPSCPPDENYISRGKKSAAVKSAHHLQPASAPEWRSVSGLNRICVHRIRSRIVTESQPLLPDSPISRQSHHQRSRYGECDECDGDANSDPIYPPRAVAVPVICHAFRIPNSTPKWSGGWNFQVADEGLEKSETRSSSIFRQKIVDCHNDPEGDHKKETRMHMPSL